MIGEDGVQQGMSTNINSPFTCRINNQLTRTIYADAAALGLSIPSIAELDGFSAPIDGDASNHFFPNTFTALYLGIPAVELYLLPMIMPYICAQEEP